MLKQLVILELSGNQLRNLPDLRSLNRLTYLNLSANRFQILPNSIRLLKRLEVLNLRGNKLQTFPDDILGCLKHLSHLTLCKNQLKNLPDCLARWPRTLTISLEDNQLTQDEIKKWESCLEQVHRDHPKLGPKIYFSEF